jgi:hypothetical protein
MYKYQSRSYRIKGVGEEGLKGEVQGWAQKGREKWDQRGKRGGIKGRRDGKMGKRIRIEREERLKHTSLQYSSLCLAANLSQSSLSPLPPPSQV